MDQITFRFRHLRAVRIPSVVDKVCDRVVKFCSWFLTISQNLIKGSHLFPIFTEALWTSTSIGACIAKHSVYTRCLQTAKVSPERKVNVSQGRSIRSSELLFEKWALVCWRKWFYILRKFACCQHLNLIGQLL